MLTYILDGKTSSIEKTLTSLGYKHFEYLESSSSTLVASVYHAQDQRVIKIVKSSSQELQILQQVGGKNRIIQLLNSVPITIPNMSNDYVLLEMSYKINQQIKSGEELKIFSRQLIEIMLFLHDNGVYYRDFKPGNIRWDGNNLTLIDFNCSMLYKDAADYPTRSCVGTKGFMAPEVLDREKFSDIRADIWNIGILIGYEWLQLYRGICAAESILTCSCENIISEFQSILDAPILVDLLTKMLQKDPNLRINAKKLLEHPYFIPKVS